jgi:hypothetical protein
LNVVFPAENVRDWRGKPVIDPEGSAAEYQRVAGQLLRTDTLLDRAMLYFDARPSHHQPTVEIRVADVCRDPRNTLLLAGLARGLVEIAARAWADGQPRVWGSRSAPDALRGGVPGSAARALQPFLQPICQAGEGVHRGQRQALDQLKQQQRLPDQEAETHPGPDSNG